MENIDRRRMFFSNKDLVRLIIPLLIEQTLAMTVGMVDTVMVAAAGESAVSAVSLVDNINILLINIFAALATGGAVVCGQFIGKKQTKRACFAADQLILFTTIISVLVMAALYFAKEWVLTTVFGQIEPDVKSQADIYFMIVMASIPFISLYNACAALFRVMGNSKISMVTSLVMNGINVVGNAVLVYGFSMGVVGVAIPTLISRIIAAVIIYILLRNQSLLVHASKIPIIKPEFIFVKKILHIGIPNGLENSMFQLGRIMVLSLISTLGTASITANAVANNIASFQALPGSAINISLITVISRCVGAHDFKQARYYTRKLISISYVGIALINIVILVLLPTLLGLYNLSSETYLQTQGIIIFYAVVSTLIHQISFGLPNTLRAANDVRYTMIVSVFSMWIFRIACSYLFVNQFNMGLFGVWAAMAVDWIVRSIFFLTRYISGKWELHEI